MAREQKTDYKALGRRLETEGASRVYLLWGEESFMRERFFAAIKKRVIGDGEESFNCRRLDGPAPDMKELATAVDSMPFLAEGTVVELRGIDPNAIVDAQGAALRDIIAGIPEWCSVVMLPDEGFKPNGGRVAVKSVAKYGQVINFTTQDKNALCSWIRAHFAERGKRASRETAEHLVLVSGDSMAMLLPEIDKVAGYAAGDEVLPEDIDAVAHRLPESRVFDMLDEIGRRDFDAAAALLCDLLQDKDEAPPKILALVSDQMRRLYGARLALDEGRGAAWLSEVFAIRYDFIVQKLMSAARGFSAERLRRAVILCAEAEFAMKNSSVSDTELLRDLLLRLACGDADA